MSEPFDYENEEEEEDEQEDEQKRDILRERTIFMIDAQADMFKEIELGGSTYTCFDLAVRCVGELLRAKVIQEPNDHLGLIFYNTRERQGGGEGGSFDHVFEMLPLEGPSAEAIRRVRDLTEESFGSEVGSLAVPSPDAVNHALWLARHVLGKRTEGYMNQIVLFTNDAQPCGEGPGAKERISSTMHRVSALAGLGVALRLFPLAAAVRPFDWGAFWRPVLRQLREGAPLGAGRVEGPGAEGEGEEAATPEEEVLMELARPPDSRRRDPASVLTQLFDTFKRRLSRKRTLWRGAWAVSDKLRIPVKAYLLVAENSAKKRSKAHKVNAVTNEPVQAEHVLVDMARGDIVAPADLPPPRKQFSGVTTVPKDRVPKVVVDPEELAAAERLPPPPGTSTSAGGVSLVLLGFKPLSPCLRDHHQLAHPTFLRPDEARGEGATAAFIALWRAMLATGRFALCRFQRGSREPRLAAVVAAEEVLDEWGAQVEPPGLHLLPLPYAEDLRAPEAAALGGAPAPRAEPEQVAVAASLLSALDLEGGAGGQMFDVSHIRNPIVQRHYTALEAIALREPIPPWDPEADDPLRPQPHLHGSQEARAAAQAFAETFPARGTKRGGGAAGGGAGTPRATKAQKAEAVSEAYDAIDWHAEARSGSLPRRTVAELQLYLRRHGLRVTGKKDDLLQRVTTHMGEQGG